MTVITVTLSPWRRPKLTVFLSNVVGLEGQSSQTFEQRLWHGNATVKLDGCFLSGLLTSGQQSQFTNFLSGFSPSATWRALVGAATFNSNTSSMSERPNSCFSLTVHWKSCTSTVSILHSYLVLFHTKIRKRRYSDTFKVRILSSTLPFHLPSTTTNDMHMLLQDSCGRTLS